ncbi:MAG: NTP transferase domain-containing protein [Bacteroidaceae bacterium]|nr:NTP transferase domain-containing protein [Bacteroidaceae bacterium]
MDYAIIAAGEGSRLAQEGVLYPKPLVPLDGVPLIERLIRIFARHNAHTISIIINSRQPQTRQLLEKLSHDFPLNIIVKDTPSSMHSMHALAPYLKADKFCLTTVDTIFREEEFGKYIERFENSDCDGMMAVTDYIDDEKPLYVGTTPDMQITGFYDTPQENTRYISGGIYALTSVSLETLYRCIASGSSRMRNFQRSLIADGLYLTAYSFGKVIDIDHVEDIIKAQQFIQEK